MRIVLSTILAFLLGYGSLSAQDVLLHNINQSITSLNPALLNLSDYQYKIGINHREAINLTQSAGLTTASAITPNRLSSIYGQAHVPLTSVDFLNVEVRILDDNPQGAIIARTDISSSLSYTRLLADNGSSRQRLAIGTTIGTDLIRLTDTDFWFGSQYDRLEQRVDLGIPSGEVTLLDLTNRVNLDLSLGLNWIYENDKTGSYFVGFALHHLNTYNQAIFRGSTVPIERRVTITAGFRRYYSSKTTWANTIIYNSQGVFHSVGVRSTVHYELDSYGDDTVALGIMPVIQDGLDGVSLTSVNIFASFVTQDLSLDISYDLSAGRITQFTDGRGTLEFGLSYMINRISNKSSAKMWLY
jgi:hypothetical protein